MKIFKIVLTALFVVVSLWADPGLDAFKAKEYEKALKLWTVEADKGEPKAQSSLSYLYFNGLGTAVDNTKGIYWLTQAAQQNDMNAQYDLGMIFLIGKKVEQDEKTAAYWLEKASEADHADAQYNVALIYYRGDGVDQNVTKAVQFLKASADSGHAGSQKTISRVYMQLLKFDKAIPWLIKDSARGDIEADYLLGEIYCGYERYAQAKEWTAKAIKGGYPQAQELWDKYELSKY